jgi:hypothetical protein
VKSSSGREKNLQDQIMSKPLDDALEAAHNAPFPVAFSADERAAIATSKAAAARGEFATDEQVRAIWAKHSL